MQGKERKGPSRGNGYPLPRPFGRRFNTQRSHDKAIFCRSPSIRVQCNSCPIASKAFEIIRPTRARPSTVSATFRIRNPLNNSVRPSAICLPCNLSGKPIFSPPVLLHPAFYTTLDCQPFQLLCGSLHILRPNFCHSVVSSPMQSESIYEHLPPCSPQRCFHGLC